MRSTGFSEPEMLRLATVKVPRVSREACDLGALGGTRTPNLLIRSQMLYPLSYERRLTSDSVRHLRDRRVGRRPSWHRLHRCKSI
jgi:hypothetical protein